MTVNQAPTWPPPEGLYASLRALGETWHGVGILSVDRLAAIAGNMSRAPHLSGETGTGVSTLFFSNISQRHLVFALGERDDSYDKVCGSSLLRHDRVQFILGPSQRTLPAYDFGEPLDLFLIDGPHAYPFPELEYYRVYPHLHEDALLVIDDVQIATVNNLFRFLCEDEMFELAELYKTTAIFRRTSAPAFDPLADNWWTQRYNVARDPVPPYPLAPWKAMVPAVIREPLHRLKRRVMPHRQ